MKTSFLLTLLVVLGINIASTMAGTAIVIETVSITDTNNSADRLTGYGAVQENYKIGKTEVTAEQYCAFLNAVAKKEDTYYLYNPHMASDKNVACIQRAMKGGLYSYTVINNKQKFPITYVSWQSAARFCNWIQHNQPEGNQGPETTETGAYNLGGAMNIVSVEKEATWFLPTEDQWYKAAYYKGNGTNAGYWLYPTQNDKDPDNSMIAGGTNNANCYIVKTGKDWRGRYSEEKTFSTSDAPRLTLVDAFSYSLGYYGTYDMGGNVFEWVDAKRDGLGDNCQVIRGGAWSDQFGVKSLQSTYRKGDTLSSSETSTLGFRVATQPQQLKLEWVTVGDPGNAADSTGYGAIETGYRIGKYPITASQYCIFLNAVAGASDPYALYHQRMGEDIITGSINCTLYKEHYFYSTKPGREKWPINYVSWFSAARFCNWVHNGTPDGDEGDNTTETGAYTLQGRMNGTTIPLNDGAKCYIPSEDQWYKAAYYKGGGTNSGYYVYPTQSDTPPGNGTNDIPNQANYASSSLTPVNLFKASGGYYGTYDMGGNVWEWNTTDHLFYGMQKIGVRGGSFRTFGIFMGKDRTEAFMAAEIDTGFRVAAPEETRGEVKSN